MNELNWRETWDEMLYLILRQWGRLVNVRTMFYNVERDFDQEVRYIASFMGKLLEVDSQVKEKIGQYVALKGLRLEMQSAVVMWWVRGNNLGKAVFSKKIWG